MIEHRTDWLEVLSELCIGDTFGHESWFVIGIEQHKSFYYCFIGDCSADEEDGWDILYDGKPKTENAKCFAGKHSLYLDAAVYHALATAFGHLARLPLYEEEKQKTKS